MHIIQTMGRDMQKRSLATGREDCPPTHSTELSSPQSYRQTTALEMASPEIWQNLLSQASQAKPSEFKYGGSH